MSDSERNIEVVRSYMKALQDGEAGDSLRRFFTEDVRQIEMPNQLNLRGQESGLEHILQRSLQGLQIVRWQSYEVVSEIAHEDRVAVEARWTGVLAVAVGTLAAGAEMKASLAMFLRFRDGRIAMQRNYDCFEPWSQNVLDPKVLP
jgi:ketosteroid isomerase-like protein